MTQSDTGPAEKLRRSHERAIAALLSHARLEDAARAAGISRSTLCRMLADARFQGVYRAARRQVLEAALSSLQEAAAAAVEALRRNLRCRKPSVEVQASRAILDYSMRSVEMLELEDRVRRLEASLSERAGGRQ